jgi:hypothetical protein
LPAVFSGPRPKLRAWRPVRRILVAARFAGWSVMAQGMPALAPLTLPSDGRAHKSPEQIRPRAALTETLATLTRPALCPARPWRLEDPVERTAPEDFPPATGDELVAGEPFPTYSPLFFSLYSLSHRRSPSRERRKTDGPLCPFAPATVVCWCPRRHSGRRRAFAPEGNHFLSAVVKAKPPPPVFFVSMPRLADAHRDREELAWAETAAQLCRRSGEFFSPL